LNYLVIKSFEVIGILGSLETLLDSQILTQRLSRIVEDFITYRETTLEESILYDNGVLEVEEIVNNPEFYLESD